MKKIVMVDCISQFRVRFAIEVEDDIAHALDEVVCNEGYLTEFNQEHLGLTIFDHYEITEEEYLKMFDKDNEYLSNWTKEQKLLWINKIQENE
jgi:hypothetical protein